MNRTATNRTGFRRSAKLSHFLALMDSLSKTSSFLSFDASSTKNIRIIDYGVTDHMRPHSSYFSSYNVLSGNQHIIVANGSNIPVTGCRNIHIQPSFLLKNVFYVPKLSNNFLFIHKVTQDLNCTMVFFHFHCV